MAAALVSGGMLSACFPGLEISSLIWVWMLPLLAALWFPAENASPGRRFWRGFGLGYLCGLLFFITNLWWLHHVFLPVPLLMAGYLALYFGIWGAFAATVGRPGFVREPVDPTSTDIYITSIGPAAQSLLAAFLNASAWCGLELLRGWLFGGFGWNGLGVGLHNDLVMIQGADLVGVTGLGFMLVFTASVAVAVLLRLVREFKNGRLRAHFDFATAVVLVVAAFFYGSGKLSEKPEETIDVRVLLVQGGIPQEEKWDAAVAQKIYNKYYKMTRRYLEIADFDLVVWPESSLPNALGDSYNERYLDDILSLKDYELALGLNEEELGDGLYNSIVVVHGTAEDARTYRKVHLVPFGEYIPLRGKFPPFEWIAGNFIDWDFAAGTSTEPVPMKRPEPYGMIPLVCFEDTIGRHARHFVREGPQLIVNVTNDGWFERSAACEQHLSNAMFRCIELRRPMARSTNTGVTCLIDQAGSLYDRWTPGGGARRLDNFIEDSMPEMVRIPRDGPVTFYARFGDVFSITLGSIALLTAIGSLLQSRRRKKQA